jgi:hypothetical protein
MNNNETKELCLLLLNADSENEIVEILKKKRLWDEQKFWRLYGDTPDNYSTAGNQANEAEAALVEKITNSRDARLMLQCQLRGINPKGENAPQSVKEAIGKFFDISPNTEIEGEISQLDNTKRTLLARGMTMALTGESPGMEKKDVFPCISFTDDGEGQTPDEIPNTILSLNKSIKSEIKFAHGKFNMGGTAVLTFCGEKNIQLVISRRHPDLITKQGKKSDRDDQWGFTIVRRVFPTGNITKSRFYYLAPIANDKEEDKPKILSFSADELNIFPDKNEAYVRPAKWGTLIKLYNYQTKARGHALRDSGLLRALDILLPDVGLPVRIHECRKSFKGHAGSFDNNLNGLQIRLSDDNVNLELKEPLSENIVIDGQKFEMSIYILKSREDTSTYRKADKGIIFSLNGQSQGWFHEAFFERVKMGYLRDSLIVIVDCSKLDFTTIELLFKNSRDRLSTHPIRYKLEAEIEDSIKNNPILKELREKRRRERTAEKLSNSKPLEQILKSVIKNNHTLSNLFLLGNTTISSFKPKSVSEIEKKFIGKRFPTFFKFKKLETDKKLEKSCHINLRSRIAFETDAKNDYLTRENSPGEFKLYLMENEGEKLYGNYKINLNNGIATLNIQLPENSGVGQKHEFIYRLNDSKHIYEPFTSKFSILVLPEFISNPDSEPRPRTKNPDDKDGKGGTVTSAISLPENIFEVAKEPNEKQTSWADAPVEFNEHTAVVVKSNGLSEDEFNANGYDWYINVDNKYLMNEMKSKPDDADIIKAQYTYSLVIIGISLLFSESNNRTKEKLDQSSLQKITFEEKLQEYSKSISPVLIPIINELSKLKMPESQFETI